MTLTIPITREAWLLELAQGMRPRFSELGHELPAFRVSCGWPGGGSKRTRIGECWYPESSADGTHELFISPVIAETNRVADVLAHELAHTVLGAKVGHNRTFAALATQLGLEGKPTATTGSEAFVAYTVELVERLGIGEYPHAQLVPSERKKQTTRQLKIECPDCAAEGEPYIARMSQAAYDRYGFGPLCPTHEQPMRLAD